MLVVGGCAFGNHSHHRRCRCRCRCSSLLNRMLLLPRPLRPLRLHLKKSPIAQRQQLPKRPRPTILWSQQASQSPKMFRTCLVAVLIHSASARRALLQTRLPLQLPVCSIHSRTLLQHRALCSIQQQPQLRRPVQASWSWHEMSVVA
jgi:hypothetical protein